MQQCIMNFPSLKELELALFRCLQQTFKEVLENILRQIDDYLAEHRDKKRFELKEKREGKIDTSFGPIVFKRNYYRDREKGCYLYLLDRTLEFDGSKGFSPLVEEWALELAATGPSYRRAVYQLEQFLGYSVMSHESLRQHLLATSVGSAKEKRNAPKVLFIEVDGLYIKQQSRNRRKKRRGHELKIAAVHEGWERNGKRMKLKNKRYYLHEGNGPFWEGLEAFLMDNYDYDPMQTKLIINGDGAPWITACRDYFRANGCFVLDRYHVARELRALFRQHPRYYAIRKALKQYDAQRLLSELGSAVGTMASEEQEAALDQLICFLEAHREALIDYRQWLQEQGIDTSGMYPMGSAESVMSQFAKRLKGGRSWSEKGVYALTRLWIGIKDGLPIRMWNGIWRTEEEPKEEANQQQKALKKTWHSMATKTARHNIRYLLQPSGTPIYQALKGLRGF